MFKGMRIPHYVIFILIGISAAIYVNRTYDCQAVDVTSMDLGVAPTASTTAQGSTFLTMIAADRVYRWAYIQQNVGTNYLNSYQLVVPTYSSAGWPLKFYVRCEYPRSPPLVVYDIKSLLLDVLIFAIAIALYIVYERFFGKRESTAKDGSLRRRIGLVDLVALTTLVAFAFGYWGLHSNRTRADEQLALEIAKAGGIVQRTALVPEPFAQILSRAMCKHFYRITNVSIAGPSTELLTKIVKIDSLQFLCITGGNYDLRVLDELPKKTLLAYLQVSGRKLDAEFISRLSGCKSLQVLNLMRTNITAKGVIALGEMPRLRELNIVHTDVGLSELANVPLSKSLHVISLPHGNTGVGDQIAVDGWPELEFLECFEFDTLRNSTPVAMTVRNCPSLKYLYLDPLQKYELMLENLPSLEMISTKGAQLTSRVKENEAPMDIPWLSRADFSSTPNVKQLSFLGDDLESMKLSDVGQLAIIFNPTAQQNSNPVFALTPSMVRVESNSENGLSRAKRQSWIDNLSKCDGPRTISFRNIPMADIDMTGLANNRGLRYVDLTNTGFSNVSQLKRLTALEQLSLYDCPISSEQLTEITQCLPNLRWLLVNKSGLEALRLRDMPNLQRLFVTDDKSIAYSTMQRNTMESIKLVNMPMLAETIHTSYNLKSLHLEGVPSVTKISLEAPFPKDTVISGLRDLSSFVAGGSAMDDAKMNEILNCKNMKKLMLAYSSVSPDLLKRIAESKELEHLILTGSQVTDEVVASWGAFGGLRTLALDKTQITSASIPWILSNQKLAALEVDGNLLTAEAFAVISKMSQLKRLSIPGATLNRGITFEIGNLISLTELDLSGCELTYEAALPLIESIDLRATLRLLKVNGGRIDDRALNGLLQSFPELRFELTDCEVEPRLVDQLVQSGRAIFEDENRGAMAWMRIDPNSPSAPAIDDVPASNFDPNRPAPTLNAQANMNARFRNMNSRSFSQFEEQTFAGQSGNSISGIQNNGMSIDGPPMNLFEQIGSWIAEAAFAAQSTRPTAP